MFCFTLFLFCLSIFILFQERGLGRCFCFTQFRESGSGALGGCVASRGMYIEQSFNHSVVCVRSHIH